MRNILSLLLVSTMIAACDRAPEDVEVAAKPGPVPQRQTILIPTSPGLVSFKTGLSEAEEVDLPSNVTLTFLSPDPDHNTFVPAKRSFKNVTTSPWDVRQHPQKSFVGEDSNEIRIGCDENEKAVDVTEVKANKIVLCGELSFSADSATFIANEIVFDHASIDFRLKKKLIMKSRTANFVGENRLSIQSATPSKVLVMPPGADLTFVELGESGSLNVTVIGSVYEMGTL